MISHQHQCIFVHIPKTAGNSINRVFGVGWENHKDLQRYHAEIPRETFKRYFKFAVVRNPWDRLFSDYNYQKKKSREKASKLFVFSERGRERDFAEWVEAALASPDYYAPERWGGEVSSHIHRWSPQVDWLEVEGVSRVDFVARLENLAVDFPQVCRRVGLPGVRLPHRNRRLHWHYSHYYDRTTRDIVSAYYARDIEQFGYEFEHARLQIAMRWVFSRASEPAKEIVSVAAAEKPAHQEETSARVLRRPIPSPSSSVRQVWRQPSALAASFTVMTGALAMGAMKSAPPSSRDLVRSVAQRSYATMAPARPAPAQDPFFSLIQRATDTQFQFVALGNGGFAVVPVSLPRASPPAPVAYGLVPNPMGPMPAAEAGGRSPGLRWRQPRS